MDLLELFVKVCGIYLLGRVVHFSLACFDSLSNASANSPVFGK